MLISIFSTCSSRPLIVLICLPPSDSNSCAPMLADEYVGSFSRTVFAVLAWHTAVLGAEIVCWLVRSEHDPRPATELDTFADDADKEVTWTLVDGTSERTSSLAFQEVDHRRQLAVRLEVHEEARHDLNCVDCGEGGVKWGGVGWGVSRRSTDIMTILGDCGMI